MTKFIRTVAPGLLVKANAKAVADREQYGSPDVDVSVVSALADDCTPDELIAVSYRLRALAKLLSEGDGEHWTLSVAGEEYTLVSEPLFRAAAKAPLQEMKMVYEVAFDAKEFLELALQEADAEGMA